MTSSRITFSAAAAIAGDLPGIDDDEEPGEEIESAPPLRVGEERLINSSGLKKKLLKTGRGWETPVSGDEVTVHCVGTLLDGTKFQDTRDMGQPLTFNLGSEQVVAGLDRAVATMLKDELSQVTVKAEYGFGNDEVKHADVTIPACSTLVYTVELVDFIKEKDLREMSSIEKIDAAEKAKGMGNDLYKIGKFHRAGKKYDKAAAYVNDDEPFDDGDKKLVKSLRVSCWLNHAACSLKLKDFHGAIVLCSKVLDVELYNVKALYRRAQAYMENADFDLAKLDIQKALNVEPHNREVKVLQTTLKQLQAESNKRDAKLYANMFEWMRKDEDVALKRLKVERVQDVKREEVHAMDSGNLVNSETQDVREDSGSDSTEAQIIDKKTASDGAAS